MSSTKVTYLPAGPRAYSAHLDVGRCCLAVQGNRLLTGGVDQGQGPLTYSIVDDSSSVKKEVDSGDIDVPDSTSTAVAIAHNGEFAVFAEGSQHMVGLTLLDASGAKPGKLAPDEIVTQSAVEVQSIAISMDASIIVVGDKSSTVSILRRKQTQEEDNNDEEDASPWEMVTTMKAGENDGVDTAGIPQGIKALAYDPLDTYLAVYPAGEAVHIYDIRAVTTTTTTPSSSPSSVAVLITTPAVKPLPEASSSSSSTAFNSSVITGSSMTSNQLEYPLAWHPRGDVLAYATAHGVAVVARSTWNTVYNLHFPGISAADTVSSAAASSINLRRACNAICWSPNGRFLAAADGQRNVTIWDMLTLSADDEEEYTKKTDTASVTGVPAIAMHGRVRELIVSDSGDGDDIGASQSNSYRRFLEGTPMLCLGWTADGKTLVYIDAGGMVGGIRMSHFTKRNGDSPKEPVEGAFEWPLMKRVASKHAVIASAEASSSSSGSSSSSTSSSSFANDTSSADFLANEAIITAVSDDISAAATGAGDGVETKAINKKYVDKEAMESETEELDEEDEGVAATTKASKEVEDAVAAAAAENLPKSKAAPAAAAAKKEDADDGFGMEVSLSSEKRALGFVDADDEEGNEGGGLRNIYTASGPHQGSSSSSADMVPRVNMMEIVRGVTSRLYRDLEDRLGLVSPQAPFQSGSTPFVAKKLARSIAKRYLLWNATGTVVSRKEGGVTRILVEFADVSVHRSFGIDDSNGYSMAALNEQALVLANPYIPPRADSGREVASENGEPASIRYRSFQSYGGAASSGEWVMQFPVRDARRAASTFTSRMNTEITSKAESRLRSRVGRGGNHDDEDDEDGQGGGGNGGGDDGDDDDDGVGGASSSSANAASTNNDHNLVLETAEVAESPVAIAVGDGWIAAATDWRRLFFIRSGKLQDGVLDIPGPVVTLAGRGALCAVAYHRTSPTDFTQRISVDLYLYRTVPVDHLSVQGARTALPQLVKTVDLPLAPNARIAYMDFASNGMLMVLDTDGYLRGLQPGFNWAWAVLADTKASLNKNEKIWPVSVNLCPPEALRKDPTDTSKDVTLQCFPQDGLVPILFGIIGKGSKSLPAVTTPRPICVPLPLRMPLIDTGDLSSFDDSYIRAELMRLHRVWCDSMNISYSDVWPSSGASGAGASSLSVLAAMTAAAGLQRGLATQDAATELDIAKATSTRAEMRESTAMDKSLLTSIKHFCAKDEAVTAVQLASRLHLERSLQFASKIAMDANRPAVSERVVQMMLVRQAVNASAAAAAAAASSVAMSANVNTFATPPPSSSNIISVIGAGGGGGGGGGSSNSSSSNSSRAPGATPTTNTSASALAALKDNTKNGGAPVGIKPSTAASNNSGNSSSSGYNPFAKKGFSSPTRKRRDRDEDIQGLATESPLKQPNHNNGMQFPPAAPLGGLNRQSRISNEARMKKLRDMAMDN